jgi:HSP20 family protein
MDGIAAHARCLCIPFIQSSGGWARRGTRIFAYVSPEGIEIIQKSPHFVIESVVSVHPILERPSYPQRNLSWGEQSIRNVDVSKKLNDYEASVYNVPMLLTEAIMMYRSLFPRDLFAELDRLQHEMQQFFELSPSIRGTTRGGFPAMNVGSTPRSVEIYAFLPGVDPASIEVNLEKAVLSISGERKNDLPTREDQATVHIAERFSGRFRRVVSLSDDLDPDAVQAKYSDGVLHISIQRRSTAQPRRITIQ